MLCVITYTLSSIHGVIFCYELPILAIHDTPSRCIKICSGGKDVRAKQLSVQGSEFCDSSFFKQAWASIMGWTGEHVSPAF